MPQVEIPKEWRNRVCEILQTEAIRLGKSSTTWRYEVYGPIREFLSMPHATGCPVVMETPPGDTYEFYFSFLGETFYGKILLRMDHKRLVIFSAHRPLKLKLSCE